MLCMLKQPTRNGDLDFLASCNGTLEELTTLQAYLPPCSRFGTQEDLQQYYIGFSNHHLEDKVISQGGSIVRNPHITECMEERANEETDRENEGGVEGAHL